MWSHTNTIMHLASTDVHAVVNIVTKELEVYHTCHMHMHLLHALVCVWDSLCGWPLLNGWWWCGEEVER